MKVPNAQHALIPHAKVTEYLLNLHHKRGRSKARLLHALGYRREKPEVLDLRRQHLSREVAQVVQAPFGMEPTIRGPFARQVAKPRGSAASGRLTLETRGVDWLP